MPNLYIANCTRQIQGVNFRVDVIEKGASNSQYRAATQMKIDPGQQTIVARGEPIDTLNYIVEQLEVYGMRAVSSLGTLTDRDFIPLLFNIDQPVKLKLIQDMVDHNHRVRALSGALMRKQAAIVSNDLISQTVERQLLEQDMPVSQLPRLDETAVEYDQQTTTEDNQTRLEEGVKVRADAPGTKPPAATPVRGRRGRPRKAA